ncbi:MAG: OB-fold putative lipoprotein [Prolixibacteraceae bacterium]|jgi:hypothetical protein|nr:OB-fold putative lipoprotein [Prolixibacteraceae bacterium]
MKRGKIIKSVIIIAVAGIIIAGAVGLYMFNMPHRNVQKANAVYNLTSSQIVTEYLTDKELANKKYLSGDGDSKVLKISGVVNRISEDFNGQKVVLLKGADDKAGVSASFTKETNPNAAKLKVGEAVTIKGVIRSGASFDKDLALYENVILEKSDVATK